MKATFFTRNRERLSREVKHPVVVAGFTATQRMGDAAYRFEQEANFWYLTGIEEADWWLIVANDVHTLVAPDVSEIHRIFDGGLSFDAAKQISGVTTVVGRAEGLEIIAALAHENATVSTVGSDPRERHYRFAPNPAPQQLRRRLKKMFTTVDDCRLALHRLRAIKQAEEIVAIENAVNLTMRAFEDVKLHLANFTHEYQVEAAFTATFRASGAVGHAYDPIVAMAKNACTLHYIDNNTVLQRGLLLMDIGARVDGYAADVTRIYAVGEPTARERAVHQAVERAQREIVALLKPGLSVQDYHESVDVIMKEALDSLGLLKNDADYRRYFPHAVSHGLGIDVHDPLGMPTEFQTGMVLTVEPGIYIPEESIGVRIEDDILITDDGHRNLSAQLPTSL